MLPSACSCIMQPEQPVHYPAAALFGVNVTHAGRLMNWHELSPPVRVKVTVRASACQIAVSPGSRLQETKQPNSDVSVIHSSTKNVLIKMYCSALWKVAGSIPDGVIRIFH